MGFLFWWYYYHNNTNKNIVIYPVSVYPQTIQTY